MPKESADLPYCQPELLGLLDVLVDVIFCIKDEDGVYLAVNHAFVRRTGRSSKRDVIGGRAADFFPPPLVERYDEQDAHVFTTGEALRDELELIRRPDGTQGWYLTTKLPVDRGADGGPPTLVSVSRDLKTPGQQDADARALSKVVEHVRAHLEDTIRVADLAAEAGLSTAQLDRRMRRTFGLSPSNYILRTRVDRAAELLADPAVPLAEVATRSGFYDQSNLTRQFARLTSETPAQFRANHLAKSAAPGSS